MLLDGNPKNELLQANAQDEMSWMEPEFNLFGHGGCQWPPFHVGMFLCHGTSPEIWSLCTNNCCQANHPSDMDWWWKHDKQEKHFCSDVGLNNRRQIEWVWLQCWVHWACLERNVFQPIEAFAICLAMHATALSVRNGTEWGHHHQQQEGTAATNFVSHWDPITLQIEAKVLPEVECRLLCDQALSSKPFSVKLHERHNMYEISWSF